MIDFNRLCKERHIQFMESGHHHSHEGWIQVHCPFCTDGSHGWHLGFSIEKGNMNCWRCGSHNLKKYLSAVIKGVSALEIIRLYTLNNHIPINKKDKTRRKKAIAPPQIEPMKTCHRKYLVHKKFNPAVVGDEWELKGTIGFSGEWNWRIIASIKNSSGEVTGYAGRALNDEMKPRWKFSRSDEMSCDPKKMIYGIEKAKDRVLIVEGISDVWRMGPGAVGLLGIDWKEEQAAILKKYEFRYIMFDPESIAQKKAQELANWLAPFPGETEIISGLKTDPGDLNQAEADNIMIELGF
jgi:hypothetical protein